MIEDRNVTITEASAILGIPRWKLYRLARPSADPKHPRRLWPVEVLRSPGCKGGVAYYRLSEVAAALADEHEDRHAEKSPSREVAPSTPIPCNN